MGAMASQITSLTIVYSKKASKLRVTGLCAGNSRVNSEFPAQRVSNAENVSIVDVIMELFIKSSASPMHMRYLILT